MLAPEPNQRRMKGLVGRQSNTGRQFFLLYFLAHTRYAQVVVRTTEVLMFKLILVFSIFALGCSSASARTEAATEPVANILSCQEGTIRRGFITPMTDGDLFCAEGTQTCVAGNWQGPVLYDSCENYTKSCDGSPHGSVINGYLQPTSPAGVPCTPATKTCLNGTWAGPDVFASCSEL